MQAPSKREQRCDLVHRAVQPVAFLRRMWVHRRTREKHLPTNAMD